MPRHLRALPSFQAKRMASRDEKGTVVLGKLFVWGVNQEPHVGFGWFRCEEGWVELPSTLNSKPCIVELAPSW